MLPYRTRNLGTKGHRTTSWKHKATIGVLNFVLEENGHLVDKKQSSLRRMHGETTV